VNRLTLVDISWDTQLESQVSLQDEKKKKASKKMLSPYLIEIDRVQLVHEAE
jgi:hypothetical protein